MSLTSYRAAPPRVLSVNREAVYRVCVNPYGIYRNGANRKAIGSFCRSKLREQFVSCKGRSLAIWRPFHLRHVLFINGKRPLCLRPLYWPIGLSVLRRYFVAFCRPGSDLLSRVLRRSTIGAGAFHGRVRKGNGCIHPAMTTRSAKRNKCEKLVEAKPRLIL